MANTIHGKILGITLTVMIMGTTAIHARRNNGLIFGAAIAAGAAAIYHNATKNKAQPQQKQYKKKYKKRYKKKTKKAEVVVTNEMMIQKALYGMGYYNGKADGEINGPTTRDAIKKMNTEFEISNHSMMTNEVRDQLVYIGHLYNFDKTLNSQSTKRTAKGKRLQTALRVHGTYDGKIDGKTGKMTKKAILKYKYKNSIGQKPGLTSNDEYNMISSAIEINSKNIKDATNALRPQAANTKLASNEGRKQAIPETAEVASKKEDKKTTVTAEEDREGSLNSSISEQSPSVKKTEEQNTQEARDDREDEEDFTMPDED